MVECHEVPPIRPMRFICCQRGSWGVAMVDCFFGGRCGCVRSAWAAGSFCAGGLIGEQSFDSIAGVCRLVVGRVLVFGGMRFVEIVLFNQQDALQDAL